MALNIRKDKGEILRSALKKLETQTPITATSTGSIARALTEIITNEIGEFYNLMDYNISQTLISTASGTSLDQIGKLYSVTRKNLSEINVVEAVTNTFYFYIDTPYHQAINIPSGTMVFSRGTGYEERQSRFQLVRPVTIPAGRRRVYGTIQAVSAIPGLVVAKDTLTVHDFVSPSGVQVKATNPKPIMSQPSFESDSNLRTRIINQLRVDTGGTTTALRFAALALEGVRDVSITSARYGLGTFEMLVVPEVDAVSARTREQVSQRIELVRPAGVRVFIKEPTYTKFNLGIGLVAPVVDPVEGRDLTARVKMTALIYLNSLLPGDTLVYSQLVQRILETSDAIRDVTMTNYATNDMEISRSNYAPTYDEQIVPGKITVSILT